jgi:hypothetical protein
LERKKQRYLTAVASQVQGAGIGEYYSGGYLGDEDNSCYLTSETFRFRVDNYTAHRTEYFEFGISDFPNSFLPISKIRIHCNYFAINDYWWNTTLLQWEGTYHNHAQCTITPYLRINGELYYGTPAEFGADSPSGHESDPPALVGGLPVLHTEKTVYYDWTTNPATGVAWTANDYLTISFGLKVVAPSGSMGTMTIGKLYPIIYSDYTYDETEEIAFHKIAASDISLNQYAQTPIKADDLYLKSTLDIPGMSELILIKDAAIAFSGFAWTSIKKSPSVFEINSKSKQIILDYRLMGYDYIPSRFGDFGELAGMEVDDLFSDDAPICPESQPTKEQIEIDSATYLNRYAYNIPIGMFYFLNSWDGRFKKTNLPLNTAWLEDHKLDTYIRPGTNDFSGYRITANPELIGVPAKVFSDLFQNLGQEVRYRYKLNGLLYQDAAEEIANGSEEEPVMDFVDGDNSKITVKIPTSPSPTATFGISTNPKVASTWNRARQYLTQCFSSSRIADDLKEYLESKLDLDDTSYEITLDYEQWHIRPGDYISVQPKDYPVIPVRARQISTGKGQTKITAGRRLLAINEQFGIWRDARYASHLYEQVKNIEIAESDDLTLSKQFTIESADLVEGWQCTVGIDWNFEMVNRVYEGGGSNWAEIPSARPPYPTEAYVQVQGESYDAYGAHEYEFQITQNMTAIGIEPYGQNDVNVMLHGEFKWRKDGGAWSEALVGYDVWHPTNEFNADLGNGLYGRVIFSLVPPGYPWATPKSTDLLGKSASAYACETVDLSLASKLLILKIDGKAIPPGRYLAKGESGSLEVDITEFCNAAGTYTLTAQLVGGVATSDNPNYYHTLSGEISQKIRCIPIEVA